MTNALISIALAWEHKLLYFESGLCMSIFGGFTPDLTSGVLVHTPSRKIVTSNGSVNQDCFLTALFLFADTEAQKRESTVLTLFMSCQKIQMRGWVEGKRQTEGDQPQELRAPCYIPNIYFRKIPNEDFCGLFFTSTFPFPTPYVTVYSLKPPSRRYSAPPSVHTSPLPLFLVRIPPSAKQISTPVMKNLLYLAAS